MRARRGFTLVELLIAMLVSSVIATAVFFVFQAQSRVFYMQESVATTQADLRFAMEALKADVKRAGFLGTLNTQTAANWCGTKPNPAMTGIQVTDGDGFVFNPAENQNIAPDSLRILGAFSANNMFYTAGMQGNVVTLSLDPVLSPGLPTTQVDFDRMFATGALLRVLDTQNRVQIQSIASQSFAQRTITLQNVTRDNVSGCGPRGLGQGLLVNPVEYVRYRVVDTSSTSTACRNSQAVLGRSTLVRENLDPTGQNVITTVPLTDYVIDMQFSFMADTGPAGGAVNIVADTNPLDFVGNATAAQVNLNPEQVRSVHVFLAARTAAEEPGVFHKPRATVTGGLGPITTFNLDADRKSACRVRSLASEVQLRNFSIPQRL